MHGTISATRAVTRRGAGVDGIRSESEWGRVGTSGEGGREGGQTENSRSSSVTRDSD